MEDECEERLSGEKGLDGRLRGTPALLNTHHAQNSLSAPYADSFASGGPLTQSALRSGQRLEVEIEYPKHRPQ